MIEFFAQKALHGTEGKTRLDVAFIVATGEFITLFGKSGAGKTTLLRILAGLTAPETGRIVVDGEVWFDSAAGINLPPQQRQVGLVFQDYALFPNMTVRGNLEFALSEDKDAKLVDKLLDLSGLTQLQSRKPETLSGGQRQRVALARALARKPRLLLLDEPLSALDGGTRLRLQDEILTLHRLFGITTLIVSHDLAEVFKLSNRVLVLEEGRIAQDGKPAEVFAEQQGSDKFRLTGEVLKIEPNDVVFVISVLVDNRIVKVIATADEVTGLAVGNMVMLLFKAFNPILTPMRSKVGA